MAQLGIDFGTSTTVVATSTDGVVRVLKAPDGEEVIASYLALLPDGSMEVGRKARARRGIDGANTLSSLKRIIGRPWYSREVREFRQQHPYELEEGSDHIPRFVTRAGALTAQEAVTYFFIKLRQMMDFEAATSNTLTLSVPVAFDQHQRTAITEAAINAGLTKISLIDEPAAAALAAHNGRHIEGVVFVYDLGGGTFDTAVQRWHGNTFESLAVGGDAHTGGDNIDIACANWATQEILQIHHWDVRTSPQSFQRLLARCEHAKVLLSLTESQDIDLGVVEQVLAGKALRIERTQIEKLAAELVQRTFVVCDETLRRARISARDVTSVVMSGGGSYMPMVRRGVEQYFGRPVEAVRAPDRLVASGAALHQAT